MAQHLPRKGDIIELIWHADGNSEHVIVEEISRDYVTLRPLNHNAGSEQYQISQLPFDWELVKPASSNVENKKPENKWQNAGLEWRPRKDRSENEEENEPWQEQKENVTHDSIPQKTGFQPIRKDKPLPNPKKSIVRYPISVMKQWTMTIPRNRMHLHKNQ